MSDTKGSTSKWPFAPTFEASLKVPKGPFTRSNFVGSDCVESNCRMEIEHVLFPCNFLNCRIQLLGGCFKRVHTIRQLDPTQSDPTKLCERTLT